MSWRLPLIYDKYRLVNANLGSDVKTLLDVGCRAGVLKDHLDPAITYTGLDLFEGPRVDVACNIERGIPFEANAFDAVVALDVLEHTDNIWFVFEELTRVARRRVIVVLPNAYHWTMRIRYLLGREMSKYGLSPTPILDRHRWLTSYRTAREFCLYMAAKHNLGMTEVVMGKGYRSWPIDTLLVLVSRNMGGWAGMFVFEKSGQPAGR